MSILGFFNPYALKTGFNRPIGLSFYNDQWFSFDISVNVYKLQKHNYFLLFIIKNSQMKQSHNFYHHLLVLGIKINPFPKSFITDLSNITHFWEIFLNVLYFGSSQSPIRHFWKIGNLDQLIDRIE